MLVLARRAGEEIVINSCVRISVVRIKGNQVSLAIIAPPSVTVDRQEIHALRGEFQAEWQPPQPLLLSEGTPP